MARLQRGPISNSQEDVGEGPGLCFLCVELDCAAVWSSFATSYSFFFLLKREKQKELRRKLWLQPNTKDVWETEGSMCECAKVKDVFGSSSICTPSNRAVKQLLNSFGAVRSQWSAASLHGAKCCTICTNVTHLTLYSYIFIGSLTVLIRFLL